MRPSLRSSRPTTAEEEEAVLTPGKRAAGEALSHARPERLTQSYHTELVKLDDSFSSALNEAIHTKKRLNVPGSL